MPVRDANGAILNADQLKVDNVVHERVLCPACGDHVFEHWPFGWDPHSAHRCGGIAATTERARKAEFKRRYRHLFR
jgi:hypothetical protein